MEKLTLYYKQSCSFCMKVLQYMNQSSISIPMKNVADHNNYEDLVSLGGKGQVPCLVIDGEPLYESDDIIQWFKKRKKEKDKEDWIEQVYNRSSCN